MTFHSFELGGTTSRKFHFCTGFPTVHINFSLVVLLQHKNRNITQWSFLQSAPGHQDDVGADLPAPLHRRSAPAADDIPTPRHPAPGLQDDVGADLPTLLYWRSAPAAADVATLRHPAPGLQDHVGADSFLSAERSFCRRRCGSVWESPR